MALSVSCKPRTVCMMGEGLTLFELGSDSDFQIFTLCIILASGAGQKKKFKNNLWTPLLPIKYPHKTPPLTNLRGGGGGAGLDPRSPPLDPRMLPPSTKKLLQL